DDESLLGGTSELLEQVLDFDVRHHFSADFAEAGETVGDAEETVLVGSSDVAGVVPAIAQDFGGFLGFVQIAAHDVGAADEEQARLIDAERLVRIGIDDFDGDAREGMADGAALGTDLAECGGAEVGAIDGDDRGTLGAAIAFEWTNAEAVFEGLRDALGEFFRASHDEAEAAEIFRLAAARVSVEEGGRSEQHGDVERADER